MILLNKPGVWQPRYAAPANKGSALANGLAFLWLPSSPRANLTGGTPPTLAGNFQQSPGPGGLGYIVTNAANSVQWTVPTGLTAATILVLISTSGASSTYVPYKTNTTNVDHPPFSNGLVYSGAFAAARYVNGVAMPGGTSYRVNPYVVAARGSTVANSHATFVNGQKVGSGNQTFSLSSAITIAADGSIFSADQRTYLAAFWTRALSDDELYTLSANPWQLFQPRRIWVPVEAAAGGTFSSTGALAAQDATVAGSAAHLTLHAATGALSAQAATVSGAAVSPHLSTGALEAQAATVAGTAARLVLHGSTGALEAQAAEVSGSASKAAGGTFDGVGVLTAQAAAIAGSAARLALHTATGSLVADVAQASGTAVHLTLHTSTGVLEAQEATVAGVAFIGDAPPEPEPETRRRRGHASQFVQARKKLALQHLLEYLTEEEPAEATKRVIAEVKAGRPIPQVQTPRIRTDLTAAELADKLIPSRVFQLQNLMPDIEPQKVIQRAIRIAQERDDEDILMLL